MRSEFCAAYALGDTDSVVGISGECESLVLRFEGANTLDFPCMADGVLWHGAIPSDNVLEGGGSGGAEEFADFLFCDLDQLVIGAF